MNIFDDYLASLSDPQAKCLTEEILIWVTEHYPDLEKLITWSSPTFVAHGTHIISFKATKKHLAVTLEGPTIRHFSERFTQLGLKFGTMNVNFPWNLPLNTELLTDLIEFNLNDKKDLTSFWRK